MNTTSFKTLDGIVEIQTDSFDLTVGNVRLPVRNCQVEPMTDGYPGGFQVLKKFRCKAIVPADSVTLSDDVTVSIMMPDLINCAGKVVLINRPSWSIEIIAYPPLNFPPAKTNHARR